MSDTAGERSYLKSHTIEGDLLTFDLNAVARDLQSTEARRQGVALVKEAGLNIVLSTLPSGERLAEHTARGASSLLVLDGRVRVQAGGQAQELPAGSLAAFNAGVPHEVEALETSTVLVTVAMTSP